MISVKSMKVLLGVVLLSISACVPLRSDEQPIPTSESNEISIDVSPCANVSSIWLGQVTDDLESVAFSSPWGLILRQQGCEVSGKLALNPNGPDIECVINVTRLKCHFNSGEQCSNEVILEIMDSQLSGKLNSCFSTESDVNLEKSTERELKELSGEENPEEFPANPHPEGCWLHSLYKAGFTTVFCEKFDDNSNHWPIGSGSGSLALTGTAIENGMFILNVSGFTSDGEETSVLHFLPPMVFAEDYLFQAAGRINSDSPQAAWGLAFEGEYSGNTLSKYLFLISNSGQYTLLRFENSQLVPILLPKENAAIKIQNDNTITIVKDFDGYEFYINGTLVETLQLPPLADNGLMLTVSVAAGVDAEFEFDNLLIRSPVRQ